jgi:hypothetical protein
MLAIRQTLSPAVLPLIGLAVLNVLCSKTQGQSQEQVHFETLRPTVFTVTANKITAKLASI